MNEEFVRQISKLIHELEMDREQRKTEFEWRKSHENLATKQDLQQTERNIMSKITDWAAQEQADMSAISGTLDGIVAGIAALDTLITNFQNSQGTLSAADQAALDGIQTASSSLKTKAAGIVVTPPSA